MSALRTRRVADRSDAPIVVPLDSAEQDRIIREFQLDKLRQDRLWKHFLAVLYGFSALTLACMSACSLLFGCGGRTDSPLSGPRCTYFALPTLLYELIAPESKGTGIYVPYTELVVNAILILAFVMVSVWAYYAWCMNEAAIIQSFEATRAARTATKGESTDAQETLLQSSASSSAIPSVTPADWRHLRLLQRVASGLLLLWLVTVSAALVTRTDHIDILVGIFFGGPICLAGLTKLAAVWSADLETQIADLKKSKYSYHEL